MINLYLLNFLLYLIIQELDQNCISPPPPPDPKNFFFILFGSDDDYSNAVPTARQTTRSLDVAAAELRRILSSFLGPTPNGEGGKER